MRFIIKCSLIIGITMLVTGGIAIVSPSSLPSFMYSSASDNLMEETCVCTPDYTMYDDENYYATFPVGEGSSETESGAGQTTSGTGSGQTTTGTGSGQTTETESGQTTETESGQTTETEPEQTTPEPKPEHAPPPREHPNDSTFIIIQNGTLTYNGTEQPWEVAIINDNRVSNISYTYTPLSENATLGENGFPWRAGDYEVAVIFSLNDGTTGWVRVILTMLPVQLNLHLEANSKFYDGTTTATLPEFGRLQGVLRGDDVRLSSSATATFAGRDAGTNIPVVISNYALIGADAGNYYIAEIKALGNINRRPITAVVTMQTSEVYSGSADITPLDAQLLNIISGDDVQIDTHSKAGTLSEPDVGTRDILFSFTLEGADAHNYRIIQPLSGSVTVEITPKPLTVDVVIEEEQAVSMSNLANITSTTLNYIYERDYGLVSLTPNYFALFTPRTDIVPQNDRFVRVSFHDFYLEGDRAFNYTLTSPEERNFELKRALMPGTITIENHDSILRIGSRLHFSHDIPFFSPSLWERVWYVGGRNPENIVARGFGSNTMELDILHDYVDQRVYLQLISANDRYEVWAQNPTDYIPFTIVLDINQGEYGEIMGDDDVWMNNPSDKGATRRQTYSASHGRTIDIEFQLWGLPNGRNSISFDNQSITGITNSNTAVRGSSNYLVNPGDAINGVITINSTFVHRGVNFNITNHNFGNLYCGFIPPLHTLEVTNIGNAPTDTMTISHTNPSLFYISTGMINSIPIDGTASFTVSPIAGNLANTTGDTEDALGDREISSYVTVDGASIISKSAGYSATIRHSFPAWGTGTPTNCERRCTHAPCNALHTLKHSPWTWSSWEQNNSYNHTRDRNCSRCGRAEHGTEPHNEDALGYWSNYDAQNHRRTRHCSTCSRFMRFELEPHVWTEWSPALDTRCINQSFMQSRNCTTCNRTEAQVAIGTRPHSFPGSTTGVCSTYTASCEHDCGAARLNRYPSCDLQIETRGAGIAMECSQRCNRCGSNMEGWPWRPCTNAQITHTSEACDRCNRNWIAPSNITIDCNNCGLNFTECNCLCFSCNGIGCEFCSHDIVNPESEFEPEREPEAKPEPEFELELEPETEPKPEPALEHEPIPKPGLDAKLEPEPETEPVHEPLCQNCGLPKSLCNC